MADEPAPEPQASPNAGVGTSPDFSQARQNMLNRVSSARQQGQSWNDIGSAISQRMDAARQAGMSDLDIHAAMGFTQGEKVNGWLNNHFQANLDEREPVTGVGDAFKNALESSSGGIMSHLLAGTPDAEHILPEHSGFATRLAYNAGTLVGDIPAMVAGSMLGKPAGAAIATAAAGPEAAPLGAAIGSGAGSFALPEAIKQTYAQAVTKGEVTGPADFAARFGAVLWGTAKQAVVGGLTMGAGKGAEALTPSLGAVAQAATKTSAELATMTTAGAAVQGKLPTVEDVVDAAILVGGMHGAIHGGAAIHETASNILGNWAKTDQTPADAVRQAYNDPTLRQQLVIPSPEEPPKGSSETPTPDGALVIPKQNLTPPMEVAYHPEEKALEGEVLPPEGGGAGGEPPFSPPSTGDLPFSGKPDVDAWGAAERRWAVETQPSFLERVKTNMWSVYRELFRPDHPINQLQDAFEQGNKLAPMDNPKFLRRVAELSGTTARYMIERGMVDIRGEHVGPSLNEIVKPWDNEVGSRNFWNYALARRTLADVSKDTGLHPDNALTIVKEGGAKYEKTFQDLMNWRNGTLAFSRDAGLISSEQHDAMVAQGEASLPIYRQEAIGALKHAAGGEKGAGKLGANPVKETTGSDLPILNMRANLMRDAFRRTELGNNNRANLATADMAAKIGMASKVEDLPEGKPLTLEAIESLGQDLGGADASYDTVLRDHLKNSGWTFAADQVPILRDGKVEAWRFEDPTLTQFLKGMDTQTMSTWQRMLVPFARFQRANIVLNPLFPLRLMTYDAPWQFITKPGARNTIADIVVGMRNVLGDTGAVTHAADTYDGWLRSGGAEMVFDHFSKNDYLKSVLRDNADPAYTTGIWNTITGPYRALQAWGQSIMQFQRAGRYIRGVQAGEPPIEAGAQSSEAAFHRGGFGGPAAKNLNALHPFFAAYLNSLEQTTRSMLGIGKTIGSEEYSALQTSAKAFALITLPVLGSWAAWKDEEWYKAVPDWQKDSGIPTPWGFIPLPPVLNFIYGAMPRRLMEKFTGDNPHAMEGMLGALGASLIPPVAGAITANVFQPVVEKLANYSFFRGRPLNSSSTEGRQPAERWTPYSSETSKGLAKFFSDVPLAKGMNLTPPEIDNFIQGWAGTLGQAAVKGAEQAATAAGLLKPNAPSAHWSDYPLISSWTSRYPSASAQPILDFNRRFAESAKVGGSLTALMGQGDLQGFQSMVQQNPVASVLHVGKAPPEVVGLGSTKPFQDTLRETQGQVMQEKPEVREVMQAHQALDNLKTTVRLIGALPENVPLSPLQQRTMQQIAKELKTGPTGQISPTDKRQLLDMAYGTMQTISEAGNKAMDKVGIK